MYRRDSNYANIIIKCNKNYNNIINWISDAMKFIILHYNFRQIYLQLEN